MRVSYEDNRVTDSVPEMIQALLVLKLRLDNDKVLPNKRVLGINMATYKKIKPELDVLNSTMLKSTIELDSKYAFAKMWGWTE